MILEKTKIKEISLAGAILFICVVIYYFSFIPPGMLPERGGPDTTNFNPGDLTACNLTWSILIHRSIFDEHSLPFYNRYIFSGTPFYPKTQIAIFSIRTLLMFFFPIWDVVKYSLLIHIFISALGIYFLMRKWEFSFGSGIISGVTLLSCGFIAEHTYAGHENIINGISWLPFAIYFLQFALEKKTLAGSILTAIFLSLQIFEGVDVIFLYSTLILLIIGLGFWFRKKSLSALIKVLGVGILVVILAISISAVKLIPSLLFLPLTNRASGVPLNESLVRLNEVILPGVGFISIFLFSFSLLYNLKYFINKLRNKIITSETGDKTNYPIGEIWVIFFLGILIGLGTFFYYVLWRFYPGFRFQRLPERGFFLSFFAFSILTGSGFESILSITSAKFNVKLPSFKNLIWALFVILILIERTLWGVKSPPMFNLEKALNKNEPFQFLSQKHCITPENPARIQIFENQTIHWSVDYVTIPLGLETIYGYDNLWHTAYLPSDYSRTDELPFLYIAKENPAKFWGMLNVREITSLTPLDNPHFKLIKSFSNTQKLSPPSLSGYCKEFQDLPKSYPQFIYENKLFLPRAFYVPHSILFIGRKTIVFPILYKIMLSPEFDPRATVLLFLEESSDKSLKISDAVFLFDSSILVSVRSKFNSYHREKNLQRFWVAFSPKDTLTVLPQVLECCLKWKNEYENQLFISDIAGEKNSLLSSSFLEQPSFQSPPPLKILSLKSDSSTILIPKEVDSKPGFIVLSEKYSLFSGWKAFKLKRDNIDKFYKEEPIEFYRANGIFTTVPTEALNKGEDNSLKDNLKQNKNSTADDSHLSSTKSESILLFSYHVPGLISGLLISVFSLLFSIGLYLIEKKLKKIKKN